MGVGCGDEKMGKATVVSELSFSHRGIGNILWRNPAYTRVVCFAILLFTIFLLFIPQVLRVFLFAANDFVSPPTY